MQANEHLHGSIQQILSGGFEHEKTKDALDWAARTYFVAALASLAQLMYFIMLLLGRGKD